MKKLLTILLQLNLFLFAANGQEFRTIETILPFTDEFVTIQVEVRDGLYYFNGDILVEEINKPEYYDYIFENSREVFTQANATTDKNRIWKDGKVPYVISASMPTNKRNEILRAINTLNQKTNLNIVERTYERDYVFLKYNGSGSCSSYIGKVGGRQTINISSWCRTGNIMHEFFHAVGFYHEHNRPDRDNYIRINWNNISSEWRSQYQKVNTSQANTFGSYDYESIMHYPRDNGNFDCLRSDCSRVGNRSYLSSKDIVGINTVYRSTSTNQPITFNNPKVPVYFGTELAEDQVIEHVIVKITDGQESVTIGSADFSVSFKNTAKQEGLRLESGKKYSYEAYVECVEFIENDGVYSLKRRSGKGSGTFTARNNMSMELTSNRRSTTGRYKVYFQD